MLRILRNSSATPYRMAPIITLISHPASSDSILSYSIHLLFSWWQWWFQKTHWEESISRAEKVDTGWIDRRAATFHQKEVSPQAAAGPPAVQRRSVRADAGDTCG